MNLRFAAAALALVCAACSSPSGPKPAELPRLEHEARVRALWSARTGDADRFVFTPALVDGSVYSAARNGTVTRLEAASGRTFWSVSAGNRLSGGVGADARSVAVANEDGEIIVLDAENGRRRWSARVPSEVIAAPAVGADLVLVRSIDNRLSAFGAQDGQPRWVYHRAPSPLIIRAPAGVPVPGGTAFAGSAGGKLTAIALSNGGVRWEATVALPKGRTHLDPLTHSVPHPAIQG